MVYTKNKCNIIKISMDYHTTKVEETDNVSGHKHVASINDMLYVRTSRILIHF